MANIELPKYLLSEKVLKDQWYFDQLTLLLRKSYGIKEQIHLYMDVVRLFNDKELELFNLLGKYDEETGLWLADIDKINSTDIGADEPNSGLNVSDLLDKLGAIFGVQRRYLDVNGSNNDFDLNNMLMYCLIYARVVRNNYDGTYKMANDAYQKLKDVSDGVIEVSLIPDASAPLTASFYLNSDAFYLDPETKSGFKLGWNQKQIEYLQKLFLRGYFDIKSTGVKYDKMIKDFSKRGYFDHMWQESATGEGIEAIPKGWGPDSPKYDASDGKTDADQDSLACIYCTWDHAFWN